MSAHVDPVVARRSLGAGLRKLRMDAFVSAERAAGELDCSVSKISRIEKGIGVARSLEVKVLLALYGVEADAERQRFLSLVGDGRGEAWYDEYQDLLGPGSVLHRYIGLESAASQMLSFSHGWIPGLLQTEEYARALYVELGRSEDDLERLIKFRIDRKNVLHRETGPLHLSVVMDETALLRPVGGPEAMRRQLEALQVAIADGLHDIRVLPLHVGFHPVLMGQFSVLTFDSGENPDLVVIEGIEGAAFQDKPEAVASFTELFHSAAKISLHGGELKDRLDQAIHDIASLGEV